MLILYRTRKARARIAHSCKTCSRSGTSCDGRPRAHEQTAVAEQELAIAQANQQRGAVFDKSSSKGQQPDIEVDAATKGEN